MADAPPNLDRILRIRIPATAVLAERQMPLQEVLDLAPGSVLEFDKHHQQPLDLRVNNKPIARGEAVMIHGKFGLRVREIGDLKDTIKSLGSL